MKKIFIFVLLTGFILSSSAQISTSGLQNTVNKVTSTARLDVNSLKTQITSTLTSKLNLTNDQQTKVSSSVTEFLNGKADIISLAKTNKTKYAAKLTSLTEKLNSNLKSTLTAEQYSKFLSLKPTTNTASNVLSQLFY